MRAHLDDGGIVVAATHLPLGLEGASELALRGRPLMLALFLRDLRLGIRAGGGALTGVLFFLAVIATIPFASAPTSICWRGSARRSCGSARCWPRCSGSTGCSRPIARTARSIS